MTRPRDERDLARLCEALKDRPYGEPGPARFEFERRRFMAQLEGSCAPDARPGTRRLTAWSVAAWAAAAAIAAAVIVGVLIWKVDSPQTMTLTGAWYLEPGDVMARGARVRVPADDFAKVVLPDGTSIWFDRGSEFALSDEMGDRVELQSGRLLAKVAPRVAPRSFSVVTDEATVVVHGTVFSVSSSSDGAVIRLHEGKIRVLVDGKEIDVEPGHQVEVGSAGLQRMGPFGAAERLADIAFVQDDVDFLRPVFADVSEDGLSRSPLGELDPSESERGALRDGRDIPDAGGEKEPQRAVWDRRASEAPTQDEGPFDFDSEPHERRGERPSRPSGGSVDLTDALERIREHYRNREWAQVAELTEDGAFERPDVLYFRGKSLEKLGRLEQAAAAFEELARLAPDRAAQSRYLAAKVRFAQGDYAESFRLASQAASEGGAMAEQARYLALRAAFAAGYYEQVTVQARRYLDDFSRGAYAEDALYSLALSLFYLEDFNASEQAFRLYLERHPEGRYAEKARLALSAE